MNRDRRFRGCSVRGKTQAAAALRPFSSSSILQTGAAVEIGEEACKPVGAEPNVRLFPEKHTSEQ
jgi:hypothetical protein